MVWGPIGERKKGNESNVRRRREGLVDVMELDCMTKKRIV